MKNLIQGFSKMPLQIVKKPSARKIYGGRRKEIKSKGYGQAIFSVCGKTEVLWVSHCKLEDGQHRLLGSSRTSPERIVQWSSRLLLGERVLMILFSFLWSEKKAGIFHVSRIRIDE